MVVTVISDKPHLGPHILLWSKVGWFSQRMEDGHQGKKLPRKPWMKCRGRSSHGEGAVLKISTSSGLLYHHFRHKRCYVNHCYLRINVQFSNTNQFPSWTTWIKTTISNHKFSASEVCCKGCQHRRGGNGRRKMAPALPGWGKVKFVILCFRGWEVPS